jgi:integrase
MDYLTATGRTAGHVEGTRIHLDHFIRVLGDMRVMSFTDADMTTFQQKRAKEKSARRTTSKKKAAKAKKKSAKKKSRKNGKSANGRTVSQGTIRSDFKSLRSAVNWAMERKPPLLTTCPFTIPKITDSTVKPFLPTEEIKRLIESTPEDEQGDLLARWLLDLDEINQFIQMTGKKMPEMLLPMQLVCSTGMRRIQLVRLKPSDYVKGRLTITSKKGAREKGPVGNQADHRVEGLGGEGVGEAHQVTAEAQQDHVPNLRRLRLHPWQRAVEGKKQEDG